MKNYSIDFQITLLSKEIFLWRTGKLVSKLSILSLCLLSLMLLLPTFTSELDEKKPERVRLIVSGQNGIVRGKAHY